MNIALLSQAMQGTMARTESTDGNSQGTGGFLELLSAMLTPVKEGAPQTIMLQLEEGELPAESVDLEQVAQELETWFQKPETLQWLKSLPQDAYRTFMDAYVGVLGHLSLKTSNVEEAPLVLAQTIGSSSGNVQQAEPSAKTLVTHPVPNQELGKHIQTIQRVIAQFSGPTGNTKEIPVMPHVETMKSAKALPQSNSVDWLPKGLNWSRPQIDVETVMYASKGSLPENLQARIEAALQKAPFSSGADGSKVFTVRLYPEQLGELVVKLERQNGELVVKLFASNQEAKQLIQSQVQQLQQTLTPHSQNVRVEVNLTQQALDAKSAMPDGSDQPEQEQSQEQPKGGSEDDEHPAEDE